MHSSRKGPWGQREATSGAEARGGGGGAGRAPGTPPRGRFGSFSQEDAGAEKLGDPLPWALGGGAQTGRPWGPAGP